MDIRTRVARTAPLSFKEQSTHKQAAKQVFHYLPLSSTIFHSFPFFCPLTPGLWEMTIATKWAPSPYKEGMPLYHRSGDNRLNPTPKTNPKTQPPKKPRQKQKTASPLQGQRPPRSERPQRDQSSRSREKKITRFVKIG